MGDVRQLTQPVIDFMAINPATHAPPVVLFSWGGLTFTGVLARASQHFTMFADSGIPIRARLQVTFNEWRSQLQEAKEVKRQTADYTRAYVVGEGQTVSDIAGDAYGDPRKWRPIAIANGILDTRRLVAGAQLGVPRLPYRDPDSGEVYE
jgi:nucleoid-associated protein YgaU